MRITTLGTSHGDPTTCRFNSATVVEVDGLLYLIDAGAPANALMIRKKMPFQALKAVFITHMHEDHVGGLSGIIKSVVKYPGAAQHTTFLLPEEEAIASLLGWMGSMHRGWDPLLLSFDTVLAGPIYNDDHIAVTAIPTAHFENENKQFPSYAYQVIAGKKTLLYTGDLRSDFSDFPLAAAQAGCDVCVCECTHFDIRITLDILATCKIERMIFNHVANKWHGTGEEEFLKIVSVLPFPCELAHDGDTFVI